jgi:hypothetical protein
MAGPENAQSSRSAYSSGQLRRTPGLAERSMTRSSESYSLRQDTSALVRGSELRVLMSYMEVWYASTAPQRVPSPFKAHHR